jgi:hypothetical protein
MPSFANFNYPSFTFKPQTSKSIGPNRIQGSLCNPNACTNFSFSLSVTNGPPEFTGIDDFQLPRHEVSATSSSSYYQLPRIIDEENPNAFSVTFSPPLPPFMSYIHDINTIKISPTSADIGSHTFEITLNDSFGASSKKYKFLLLVKKDEKKTIIPKYDENHSII